jgi:hypothetical protein
MTLVLVGVMFVVLGLVIELAMGSFRHWLDWTWPRSHLPVAGEWLKLMCARVGTVIGAGFVVAGLISTMVDQ